LIEHLIGLIDKPDCELCRRVYDSDAPPCAECVPPLKRENELIRKIYDLSFGQVGVNNAAVFQIIERYIKSFQKQEYCFEILQDVSKSVNEFIAVRNEKQQQQQHSVQ